MMGGTRVLFVLILLFAAAAGVTAAVQLELRSVSWEYRSNNVVAGVSDANHVRSGEAANSAWQETPASEVVKEPSPASPTLEKFSVTIRKPAGPPRVITPLKDIHGGSVTVGCSTCHTIRPPNPQNKTVKSLDEFHSGMAFSHGTVSCLSCHNPTDYDSLQLADGSRVDFTEVMTLCGQCHGPQLKDYEHGVHGGLNGYWDLTRGPQRKNNCVDCHNPHVPQFPKMQPTFKPKDRFLESARSEH